MQHNLSYIPYYQPLSSPSISFAQNPIQNTHGYQKQLNPINTTSGFNQLIPSTTTNIFQSGTGNKYSNLPLNVSNALIHQNANQIIQNSGTSSYLKSPTVVNSQNGNLSYSNVVGNIQLDLHQQPSTSRHSRSPTKSGVGPVPQLRSSSSKHSYELANEKPIDVRSLLQKTGLGTSANFNPFDKSSTLNAHFSQHNNLLNNSSNSFNNINNLSNMNVNGSNIKINSLTSMNGNNNFLNINLNGGSQNNINTSFSKNNNDSINISNNIGNNQQGIEVNRKNGRFEVKCDSLHKQSEDILNLLKNQGINLSNIKQTIVSVKELESKFSTLYSLLCSQYESYLLGKDPSENTQIKDSEKQNNQKYSDIKQTLPCISITPLDSDNKILKITKIPENIKYKGENDYKMMMPHTTKAGDSSDKKIPIIASGNDITVVLNEIKGNTSIQTFGNNEKIFKTDTDEDPTDQYSKDEIKQRFLAMNDDNPPQLLSLPSEIKKKLSNSPNKLVFDGSGSKKDYKSTDEIEKIIQQYKVQGMSRSVNHQVIQDQKAEGESSASNRKKQNTRGNSISHIKSEDQFVDEEPVKQSHNQTFDGQVKRKLSDILENSRDNTERKIQPIPILQVQKNESNTPQNIQGQNGNPTIERSPGSNKHKKNSTQELMDRVNNVLQRSDIFLMKHSDKKLKKGQSKNFTNVTADEGVISQQQQEYDQSSEIKAIMDSIKKRQDNQNKDVVQENTPSNVKQNLNIKFSQNSPSNLKSSASKEKKLSNKFIENNSHSAYIPSQVLHDQERKSVEITPTLNTNVQNNLPQLTAAQITLAQISSPQNTPASNKALQGNNSGTNASLKGFSSPQSIPSYQPITHDNYSVKSSFQKAVINQPNNQFGSFAHSSPQNSFGLDIAHQQNNKGSISMNSSPRDFKSNALAQFNSRADEIVGDGFQLTPNQASPQLSSTMAIKKLSQTPALSESISSNKTSNKVESTLVSQKNSAIQYVKSDSQTSVPDQSGLEKFEASPKNFNLHTNSTTEKTPQTQNNLNQQSKQASEIQKDNLNSYARSIGQSGVYSPSSYSSNQSAAVQVIGNHYEMPLNHEEQPHINPFMKECAINENTQHPQAQLALSQLKQSQSSYIPLYEQLDPFTYSIKNFEVGKKLGHGKFADVYAAVDKNTGFRVALKQIKKETIKEFNLYQDILNEIKVQGSLNHPNIIKLYGFFIDSDSIYLIQELACGKELFTEQKSTPYKKFTESQASFYVKQVIEALIYMHSKNVVHRDLKPENIMVFGGLLKLCDFGYAAKVEKNKMRNTFCGTLDYVSPEMVQGKAYDFSVDVWSVGILTYELIIGYAPFAGKNHDATFDQIVNGELRFSGPVSFESGDFISRILERDPKSRMNLTQALQHPFIQNEYIKRLQNDKGGEIDFSDLSKM